MPVPHIAPSCDPPCVGGVCTLIDVVKNHTAIMVPRCKCYEGFEGTRCVPPSTTELVRAWDVTRLILGWMGFLVAMAALWMLVRKMPKNNRNRRQITLVCGLAGTASMISNMCLFFASSHADDMGYLTPCWLVGTLFQGFFMNLCHVFQLMLCACWFGVTARPLVRVGDAMRKIKPYLVSVVLVDFVVMTWANVMLIFVHSKDLPANSLPLQMITGVRGALVELVLLCMSFCILRRFLQLRDIMVTKADMEAFEVGYDISIVEKHLIYSSRFSDWTCERPRRQESITSTESISSLPAMTGDHLEDYLMVGGLQEGSSMSQEMVAQLAKVIGVFIMYSTVYIFLDTTVLGLQIWEASWLSLVTEESTIKFLWLDFTANCLNQIMSILTVLAGLSLLFRNFFNEHDLSPTVSGGLHDIVSTRSTSGSVDSRTSI